MPTFTKLASEIELPPADEAKEFPCGAKTICIANVNGAYSAMDNVCLHRGGWMSGSTFSARKRPSPTGSSRSDRTMDFTATMARHPPGS